jgi:hypothetical protein
VKDFPDLDDITTPIPIPFAIAADGFWFAIGIGRLGIVLRHKEDDSVLRWIGQVVKFSPQAEYLAPETVFQNLREQGIVGIECRSMA